MIKRSIAAATAVSAALTAMFFASARPAAAVAGPTIGAARATPTTLASASGGNVTVQVTVSPVRGQTVTSVRVAPSQPGNRNALGAPVSLKKSGSTTWRGTVRIPANASRTRQTSYLSFTATQSNGGVTTRQTGTVSVAGGTGGGGGGGGNGNSPPPPPPI